MYGFVKQGEFMLSGNTQCSDGCWADEQAYSLLVLTEGEVRASYFKTVHGRRRKQTETEERGKRAGKGGTERGWGREASRERQSEGERGRSVSFSGCQQHQQQQQQLGSGREVTGAEGEGVCVCVLARARVCARRASWRRDCRSATGGSTCSLSAPLCPLCVAASPSFPFPRDTDIWRGDMWRGLKYGMQRWFLPRRRSRWQRCVPLLFGPSSTFSVWRLGESHGVSVHGAETSCSRQTKRHQWSFSFFFNTEVMVSWFFFFLSSVKKISGQTKKDERIYPENFTRILDRLLDGYDNRLRPGFGGM